MKESWMHDGICIGGIVNNMKRWLCLSIFWWWRERQSWIIFWITFNSFAVDAGKFIQFWWNQKNAACSMVLIVTMYAHASYLILEELWFHLNLELCKFWNIMNSTSALLVYLTILMVVMHWIIITGSHTVHINSVIWSTTNYFFWPRGNFLGVAFIAFFGEGVMTIKFCKRLRGFPCAKI